MHAYPTATYLGCTSKLLIAAFLEWAGRKRGRWLLKLPEIIDRYKLAILRCILHPQMCFLLIGQNQSARLPTVPLLILPPLQL